MKRELAEQLIKTALMTLAEIVGTRNKNGGFYNVLQSETNHYPELNPDKIWPITVEMICERKGMKPERVRDALDSRNGQHFGEEVVNLFKTSKDLKKALKLVIDKWRWY